MKKFCSILCFFLCLTYITVGQQFIVYDTIPIKHGTSKLRLYRNIEKWFEKEKGQKLLGKNWKELKFVGKGYFPYANYVRMPDVYLSSHAAEKTKGSIVFNINIEIQDSIIVAKFSNFLHEARFTEYGSTSFGRLMNYEKVPSGKCMEVEEWCNAVWADMKAWAVYETKTRAKRMIPSTLVRKRTYKVHEEEVVAPPTAQPFDNAEYLKLENYLLKDTEGKYADYNKDPEEIEAEKAAAAAALAEKEKKKHKEAEVVEEPEETDEQTEEAPSVVQEKETVAEKETAEPADDEDYDDEEEQPAKKSKGKKEEKAPKAKAEKESKPAKAAKEKKPKKPADDYDDYDEEDEDDDDY